MPRPPKDLTAALAHETNGSIRELLGIKHSRAHSLAAGDRIPTRHLWAVFQRCASLYGEEKAVKMLLASLRAWRER